MTSSDTHHLEQNPLTSIPFEIPFSSFSPEQIEPAISQLIARTESRIATIESLADELPTTPLYQKVAVTIESASEELELASVVIGHLESVNSTPEWRAAYNAIQQPLSRFSSRITLSEPLWLLIKTLAAGDEIKSLPSVAQRYVTKLVDDFRRQGAELSPESKNRLKEIDAEIATLTTTFAQHTLDATNQHEWLFEDEQPLRGLPPTAREGAAQSARERGKSGYRLSLQAPSYIAAMTYLEDATLREQIYRAFTTRASSGGTDNTSYLLKILALRRERAQLLGFDHFADLVLDDRMAKKGEKAREFLRSLARRVRSQAARENEELLDFRRKIEGSDAPPLQAWDVAFYSEKQRKALYDFDEEEVRAYFPVDVVLQGLFDVVSSLFGVTISPSSLPVWHPDVRAFTMYSASGETIGSFYADLYPRESKRGGAWMGEFIHGRPVDDNDRLTPHLGLICANFTPPTESRPALLAHDEVSTLFHEFGHLIHHLFSAVPIPALGGTKVAWDFVELPSQILENWTWHPEVLDRLSSHYQTGEKLPQSLFERMLGARNFRIANFLMRQIGFGLLDLALHIDYQPERDGDILAYARALAAPFSPTPLPADYAMVTTFNHLFSSPVGYGAGYYSYLWAEVLDADAFTRFEQEGLFNRDTGNAFRQAILSRGNSADPISLFAEFMGREPLIDALLKRAGISSAE